MNNKDNGEAAPKRLGQYFTGKHEVIENALETQEKLAAGGVDKRLGELLLEEGSVTPQELDECLRAQRWARLSLSTLFAGLPDEELIHLCRMVDETSISAGAEFIPQDTVSDNFFVLVDAAMGELWSKVAQGEEINEIRFPIGRGVAGYVAQHEELVNIKDAYEDSRFNPEVDRRTGYKTNSILCGPVKNFQGETIGVIQVINKCGGPFTKQDEEIFTAISYQTAIAVENFHLCKRILASHGKMSILLDVANTLSQTLDLETLIPRIIAKLSEILDADRGTLFLLDRDTNELWSKVAEGAEISEIRVPATAGLAGQVVVTREILNIGDAYDDHRFSPEVDRATGYRTKSILCAPVLNREGEVIGVTQAVNKREGRFEKQDEELLQAVSSQIAVLLENSQLYEETLNIKNYLQNVHESITNGIITLDNEYYIVMANRAAKSLFQLKSKDLQIRDFRDVVGSRNEHIPKYLDQVYDNNRARIDYGVKMVTDDQKTYSLNLNFVPLIDHRGERQGQVLIFEDISREKRIKSTLTRYMAKDIVDKVLADPEIQELGGVVARQRSSFLISEVRAALREVFSRGDGGIFERVLYIDGDIIFQEKGVLDKFIGDAIMAVFGVPYARNDDAERAVRTALEMREELSKFNGRRAKLGESPVHIGIGICTGDVLSGNIGSEKRMDFTVIGVGVNIAARLESLNKQYGTKILISDSTFEDIGGRFVTRVIDKVIVKGSSKPIQVYEVLGDRGYVLSGPEKAFRIGWDLYSRRDFGAALKIFEENAERDAPSKVFLNRCKVFTSSPPESDWNGVWVSTEK